VECRASAACCRSRAASVEQRQWLTEREFTEVLSLSQFLPGPNIVNVTIIIGRRFCGVWVRSRTLGLMLMPMIVCCCSHGICPVRSDRGGAASSARSVGGGVGPRAGNGAQDGAPLATGHGRSASR